MQNEHYENIKKNMQQNFSKAKTNKMMDKKKEMNFGKIFEKLDSDHDGQISAFRIDISSIDASLLQILTPLFVEMEDLGMNLNQNEFIEAASRLYDSVSLPEKSLMLNGQKRNSERSTSKNLNT